MQKSLLQRNFGFILFLGFLSTCTPFICLSFFQWSLAASGHVFARSPENSQLAGKWQVLVRHVINNDIYGVLKRFDKYFGIWIMEFTVFESGLEANGR